MIKLNKSIKVITTVSLIVLLAVTDQESFGLFIYMSYQ